MIKNCYCNANKPFSECCEPYILGIQKVPTAKALMASRYSAYCVHDANYLIETTHISTRKFYNKTGILDFATRNQWTKLEIINFSETIVEFKAYYVEENNNEQIHHEKSKFRQEQGNWFYVDGEWY